jgi:putative N6-adenine-specific DNA methylase
MHKYFAVTAPGLKQAAAGELSSLGLQPINPSDEEVAGGLEFEGELVDLYRANLYLRTAGRVLQRAGEFYAATFPELRRKAGRLSWEGWLAPGQPVALRVTCHKSRLYHSTAVAERIAGAIGDRLGKNTSLQTYDERAAGPLPQLIIVRLLRDQCMISIDSSGEGLHRRGYRQAAAKAPLRETLAAGILLASGWDSLSPLWDPFCGSGTIPIEAALLAHQIPPGFHRRFAFMDWPGFANRVWDGLLEEAGKQRKKQISPIWASDRDAGAVAMAQANADRAGVLESINFSEQPISSAFPPSGKGWVVTNPPYGLRVSSGKDLRNLYARLGDVLRQKCSEWQVAILSNDDRLLGATRLHFRDKISTVNGGVPVKIALGKVTPLKSRI